MPYRLMFTAAVLLLGVAANLPEEEASLDGAWNVTSTERGGRKPPEELLKRLKVIIKSDMLKMTDGEGSESATFKLDPSATPKKIDLVFKEGPNGSVIRKALGIYELNGDNLKLAWRKDGGPRPEKFISIPGERTSELLVLTRAVKEQ